MAGAGTDFEILMEKKKSEKFQGFRWKENAAGDNFTGAHFSPPRSRPPAAAERQIDEST